MNQRASAIFSTLAAFAVVPLVPTLLIMINAAITSEWQGHYFWAMLSMYLPSAIVELVFGVPAYLLGRRLKLIRWWSALIVGAVTGAMVFVALQWNPLANVTLQSAGHLAIGLVLWSAAGAISGAVFWGIWILGHNNQKVVERKQA
jgi:hypothetical protein